MTNNVVTNANDLIEARYTLNLNEQKIILYAVSNLERSKDKFNVLELKTKEFMELIGASKFRYTEIKKIVKGLMKKQLSIETKEFDLVVNWVTSVKYIKNTGIIELEFSENLVPYLLQLQKEFTRYQLKNILYLKNKYSIRMYELLKQYEKIGKRDFTINKLKDNLMIQGKYDDFRNLESRVIKKAIQEINEYTDLHVDYEKIKTGRSVTSILFKIASKSGLEKEIFNSEQIIELFTIATEKLSDAEQQDIFDYIRINYLHMLKNETVKNKYAYLKKALQEDYACARGQIKFDFI